MQITLVPTPTNELTVYQVLDDLGEQGHVWREIADSEANEPTIIEDIITSQYDRPLRVVAFNTEESWARDVTKDVADRLLNAAEKGRVLGAAAREFIERVAGRDMTVVV